MSTETPRPKSKRERMSDEEFALHERGEARQRGRLLAEARRARRGEAEKDAKLARIQRVVEEWGHTADCARFAECDEAEGEPCVYHDGAPCPSCECGKGEILGILAAPEGK